MTQLRTFFFILCFAFSSQSIPASKLPVAPAAATNPLQSASDPALEEKLREAAEMADAVLEGMGLDLPEIVILPNSNDAHAAENIIYIGDQMISSLDVMTLAQILLHEVGHINEGHTGLINMVMDQLLAEGLLTPEEHSEILRNDELIADAYAAIGSWLLEPGVETSAFSQYMAERNDPPSDTHPSSQERIEFVENLIDLLALAEFNGAFQEAGLESVVALHSEGLSDGGPTAITESPEVDSGRNDPEDGDANHGGDSGVGGSDGDGGGDGGGGDGGGG